MNIIIAGAGRVGQGIAQQLSEDGHDLTLIDSNHDILKECVNLNDVIAVMGNCASMETLKSADIQKAQLLIAATGNDEVNLLCCMTAHGMNPKLHTMARIRDPEYAENAYSMRDLFGISVIFNPEQQTAREMERLLKYPGFLKRESFAKGRVEIVELQIEKESKLDGVTLFQLNDIVKCRVLVCAVSRNGETIIPSGSFRLAIGDRIYVTAPTDILSLLLKNLGIVTHKVHRAVLLGGGSVGYYLAQRLESSHIKTVIVEQDIEICRRLAQALPKTQIIQGDATNQSLLDSVGFSDCDALVSLTGSDELNMVLSLYGHSCDIPQIITKMAKGEDSKITDSLPLGSVVCPKQLCSVNVTRYVRALDKKAGGAITIHPIAGGRAEAMEFLVDEHTLNCGVPLKEMKLKSGVLLTCITRKDQIEIPGGDSSFAKGDYVVIVAQDGVDVENLNDIFA